ncbi:ricin-type beta-trefoil lectin domain protein [Solwaraspora sp. WMMD791]|uniref:RICIN domain-containing protein n=1 Tax=Solwaraspora sp. WMMD791 TaxID=3016086 RepID=UPI00249C138E|nr:ricin-type beta-trefoil lectin domain protein [Solwaraspora sp. WMMD791]WFE27084.1 ricin-type beta-trefoil lectin domain protein [Solwaraspora sp. WMMD791]
MSEQIPPTSRLRGFAASFAASARRSDDEDGGDHRSPLLRRVVILAAVTAVVALAVVGVGFMANRMAGDVDRTAFARPTTGTATAAPGATVDPSTSAAADDAPDGPAIGESAPGGSGQAQVDPVANAPTDAPAAAPTPAGGSGTASANGAGGTTTTGSPAPRTTAPPANQGRAIVSFSADKCIDVVGGQGRDGSPLQIWDCTGSAGQRWTLQDGTIRAMGLCMDAAGGSMADGTPLQLARCNGGQAQRWTVNAAHDLVNTVTGRCVDVRDNGTGNGTRLQLWSCAGTGNQKWRLR